MNSKTHATAPARLCVLASLLLPLAVSGVGHAAPDLDILASAGLGDELGGRPVALDLAGDGLVLASERAGHGEIVRLDRAGERTGQARALTGGVDDLAVDRRTGNIAVVGPAGLQVFDRDLAPLWQRPLAGARVLRVAVGEHGTVAALADGALQIFAADGEALGRATTDLQSASDLAVLDAEGLVVTTGWTGRTACDTRVDVAALAAFARDGAPRWQAYGDVGEDALCGRHGDPASTRGVAVSRGDDGHVYLLAEVEGRHDIFRARPNEPGRDANNVGFDVYTDPETAHPQQHAYFARFDGAGRHLLGQYFLMPAAGSLVHPRAIGADVHGNVYIAGAATHSLGAADEVAVTEALDRTAGFFQVVEPDFEARRVWQQLDADDMRTDLTALVISDQHAFTLLAAEVVDGQSEGALPSGPGVIAWPGGFGPVAVEKRPDPDTQGTFGYESGVSGSDPTCYCDSSAPPSPAMLLTLAMFTLAGFPRRSRRG